MKNLAVYFIIALTLAGIFIGMYYAILYVVEHYYFLTEQQLMMLPIY